MHDVVQSLKLKFLLLLIILFRLHLVMFMFLEGPFPAWLLNFMETFCTKWIFNYSFCFCCYLIHFSELLKHVSFWNILFPEVFKFAEFCCLCWLENQRCFIFNWDKISENIPWWVINLSVGGDEERVVGEDGARGGHSHHQASVCGVQGQGQSQH